SSFHRRARPPCPPRRSSDLAPGPGPGGQMPRRRGNAMLYTASPAGAWRLAARLDPGPDSVLTFGAAVYLDADGLVVGAPVTGGNQGAVFVFTAAGAGWALDQRIV